MLMFLSGYFLTEIFPVPSADRTKFFYVVTSMLNFIIIVILYPW